MLVTQKELADVLGVSARWIRELSRENGLFMSRDSGKYILSDCVREFVAYKIETETTGGSAPDYWEEKAKHEHVKRKISEQKLSRIKRESFDASDVEDAWGHIILNFKNKLSSFPHKLAVLLANESSILKITNIISSELEALLYDLSEFSLDSIETKETYVDDEDEFESDEICKEDTPPVKTSKKANSKSVGGRKSHA